MPEPNRTSAIACLILAAGRSTRMAPANKLLETLDGRPVIRHAAEAAMASRARPVVVVTGHDAERVHDALAGLDVSFAHNPDYADGMATSLARGLAELPRDIDGVLILLGDMPRITSGDLEQLIAAFMTADSRAIIVPVSDGRRGNPVLWAARYIAEMRALQGDQGARSLMQRHASEVREVTIEGSAIFADVDTPEALAALKSKPDRG